MSRICLFPRLGHSGIFRQEGEAHIVGRFVHGTGEVGTAFAGVPLQQSGQHGEKIGGRQPPSPGQYADQQGHTCSQQAIKKVVPAELVGKFGRKIAQQSIVELTMSTISIGISQTDAFDAM